MYLFSVGVVESCSGVLQPRCCGAPVQSAHLPEWEIIPALPLPTLKKSTNCWQLLTTPATLTLRRQRATSAKAVERRLFGCLGPHQWRLKNNEPPDQPWPRPTTAIDKTSNSSHLGISYAVFCLKKNKKAD